MTYEFELQNAHDDGYDEGCQKVSDLVLNMLDNGMDNEQIKKSINAFNTERKSSLKKAEKLD